MNAVVTTPSSNPFGAALTAPRVASSNALAGSNQQREIAEVQAELERSLTDTDRAWRAWESFVEHLGTKR